MDGRIATQAMAMQVLSLTSFCDKGSAPLGRDKCKFALI